MSRFKRQLQAAMCDDHEEDNDTPVQSQPCRDAGTRNEGGSERSSEEFEAREAYSSCRLIVSLIRGVVDKFGSK